MCVTYPELCEECLERLSQLKYNFHLQSEDITTDLPPANTDKVVTNEETVEFMDLNNSTYSGFYHENDPNSVIDETPLDLKNFLSRPVKIANFIWAESDAIGTIRTFEPWDLFFNDTRIKKKLDNFAFLQADLKIKVMVNASPFYFGSMLSHYIPLPQHTPTTVVPDGNFRYFTNISQRPHMWVNPQDEESVEMVLPYFNFRNWLRVQIRSDFQNFGTLNFVNFTTLDSANAVGLGGAAVTIYAWAENVKISGNTLGLALQSSDEYGQGVISKPASAVAYVATQLENVPIIGKFATATRIGATAISSIASMFGFTNVPVVADTMPFRNTPFPQMATCDIGYPVEKLTLDPKNELTVDPSVVGLPPTDELALANIVQKESYLTTVSWATSGLVDRILFTSVVNPLMYNISTATNPQIYMTPMCWASLLFKGWRGDIIFRFKFIASRYHRGRVRISYDPAGTVAQNLTADPISSSVVFTKIVDLAQDTDVEIRIPYQQAISWLISRDVPDNLNTANVPWSTSTAPAYIFDPARDNGTIQMRILNTLTAPIATSTVKVLVFVRAADNFELANPVNAPTNASIFTLQSADVYGTPETSTAGKPAGKSDCKYLVNYGETVQSLRSVLRRMNLSMVWCEPPALLDDKYTVIRQRFTKWPLHYGYDPSGIQVAKGLLAPLVNFPFNWVHNTTYNWIAPAFVGQRGSMIWSINVDSNQPINDVKIIKVPLTPGNAIQLVNSFVGGTPSADAAFFRSVTEAGSSGMALTTQQTQAGLSFLCPNFTQYRFQTTDPKNCSNPTGNDGSFDDNLILEISPTTGNTPIDLTIMKIWKYSGIGTDFNLHFFLNVPVFTLFATTPVAG